MALLSIDEGLEFRLRTIKGIQGDQDLYNNNGTYIQLHHESDGDVAPFIYDNELGLLLDLLECSKDKIIGKKVIVVSCRNELLAIGHNDNFFRLLRDKNDCLDQSQPLQLLSREELCTALDNFNVYFIGKDGAEVPYVTSLYSEENALATSHITPKK